MYIKRSIKFLLHQRNQNTDTNIAIRMRVNYESKSIDFPTYLHIDKNFWDAKKCRAKSGFKGKNNQTTNEINRTLDELQSCMNDIFARFELLEKRTPSTDEIKDLFNDTTGRKVFLSEKENNCYDFFKVYDLFVKKMGETNNWTFATFQKFASIKVHLQNFDKNLNLSNIDDSKLQEFVKYMHKKGLRNTTIAKILSFVKWFIRWAANNDYYKGKAHITFKPKLKGIDGNVKEVIYLSMNEIKLLQQKEFKEGQKYLERVRDVFLFLCFTGLRYSDVAKLTKTDIKDGYFVIVTQKTADGLRIELNKYAQEIIDKYKNFKSIKGLALPVISNVKMNEYLKELGRVCDLNEKQRVVFYKGNERNEKVYSKWELLTTHCGRRTFVVSGLQLGIPAEVIMRWTGHSDFVSLKPYVKIVDELKQREMQKFNSMLG